ncbi:RidA family protein [Phytomonospora endophytica]|uniref:Enamine deaminase RidA (YjgF/YER057c/UK114 family) n=1 Tax=Phytomonospora endophytica TaxID=714109 RepID=A0A841FGP7_9ACTN|nr:RidA family protein [Phytomonospora endophytica]MBB6035406.1 enamine deaminase RidA (YjgF/YER057c/UK114 family) [Phytomonospora endophytica]GIG63842.1 enamine deaminase RidA [Phytomonospora endophytica]
MPHTIINPDSLHDPVGFGYSHVAATSGELVLLAGQYASDAEGQVTTDDFAEQVATAFANLGKALAAAGLGFEHVARLRTFVVDHDLAKLAVIGEVIGGIWGAKPPVQTLTGVAALALPGMRFEVDAVAVRG